MRHLRESELTSYARSAALSAPDGLWELTQLERGEYRAKASMHPLGEILIGKASTSHASLHRIKAPFGCVSVIIGGSRFNTMFVAGYRVAPQDCIVLSSNAEVEAVTHRHSDALS